MSGEPIILSQKMVTIPMKEADRFQDSTDALLEARRRRIDEQSDQIIELVNTVACKDEIIHNLQETVSNQQEIILNLQEQIKNK